MTADRLRIRRSVGFPVPGPADPLVGRTGYLTALWTVKLQRGALPERLVADWTGEATSEDEAIGRAIRHHGVLEGWEIVGWWPTGVPKEDS